MDTSLKFIFSANHMALFRSNSAPVESTSVPPPTQKSHQTVTPTQMRNISNVHKAYRSYSDDSSNYSSGSSGSFDLPPSRYHHTKKFKRRVTFNEAVQVFEVSRIPILEPEVEKVQQIVPYTKTRMKIKKDTVKFEEIVSTSGHFRSLYLASLPVILLVLLLA